MFRCAMIAAAVALACAAPARGEDGELAKIRDEIRQMKENYEQRIQQLEKRLAEAEAKAGKAQASAAQAETAASAAASARSGENAFNPAVSLVLQGTYARASQDPNTYHITGFMPSGGEVGPPKRSFGLGESELAIAANIDPYFRGTAIASLAPDGGIDVEEAYFQTLGLQHGLTLKGGRFFSGIGYLNEQHQHAWDFQDAPLPYKAFLGNQFSQDGVQLKWVAPTDLLVELGAELGNGARFPGSERSRNGAGAAALLAHVGGDIGESYAWRSGVSYLRTSSAARAFQDSDALGAPVTQTFDGNANVWIADAILKWAPHGNATYNNFKVQGEYFRFNQDGSLTYDDTAQAAPRFGTPLTSEFNSRQSGWYLQGVWQFQPAWRVGYRYDRLNFGSVSNGIVNSGLGPQPGDFGLLRPYSPVRNTLMFDWSPTEFTRLRLQLAQDKSRLGGTDHQVLLQYLYSLGAHGAHKF